MAAKRTSQRVAQLASQVAGIRSGPALPSEIKGLRVRVTGLKGNAGASWWAKQALPPIAYASPSVQISVAVPAVSASTSDSAAPLPTPAPASQPWSAQPGVFIQFNDPSLPEAFFPLTQARSDVLIKRFWDTVQDPAALEKLRQTPTGAPEAEVEGAKSAGEGVDLAAPEGAVGKDLLL